MPYIKDDDLEFLSKCSSTDLSILYNVLTRNKKGARRFTESLTADERVIKNYPDHSLYWDSIAAEVQHFGGNTFANTFRGCGVLYKKILRMVCRRYKVKYDSSLSTGQNELRLLVQILSKSAEKMSKEELIALVEGLNLKTTNFSKAGVLAALQTGIEYGGFAAYRATVIVANSVAKAILGRGLTLAANAMLTRSIGILAGPIGWTITTAWAFYDIAGPAYRVIIPAVIEVAYLRAKSDSTNQTEEINIKPEESNSPTSDDVNIFSRCGDFWEITYDSKLTRIRDLVGLRYIAVLLANPRIPNDCIELVRKANPDTSADGPTEDGLTISKETFIRRFLDKKAIRHLKRRLSDLDDEIEEATQRGESIEKIEELSQEKTKILKYLRDHQYGYPALTPGAKKAANSVTKAMKEAIKKIRKEDALLAAHLTNSLKFGLKPVYMPERDLAWKVVF